MLCFLKKRKVLWKKAQKETCQGVLPLGTSFSAAGGLCCRGVVAGMHPLLQRFLEGNDAAVVVVSHDMDSPLEVCDPTG